MVRPPYATDEKIGVPAEAMIEKPTARMKIGAKRTPAGTRMSPATAGMTDAFWTFVICLPRNVVGPSGGVPAVNPTGVSVIVPAPTEVTIGITIPMRGEIVSTGPATETM